LREIVRISQENERMVKRLDQVQGTIDFQIKHVKKKKVKRSLSSNNGTVSIQTFYKRKMSRASGRELI
jgi:hypothetical protein